MTAFFASLGASTLLVYRHKRGERALLTPERPVCECNSTTPSRRQAPRRSLPHPNAVYLAFISEAGNVNGVWG